MLISGTTIKRESLGVKGVRGEYTYNETEWEIGGVSKSISMSGNCLFTAKLVKKCKCHVKMISKKSICTCEPCENVEDEIQVCECGCELYLENDVEQSNCRCEEVWVIRNRIFDEWTSPTSDMVEIAKLLDKLENEVSSVPKKYLGPPNGRN